MTHAGAASAICESYTPPRSSGGVGKSPPLQTSAAVHLSMQFFHDDKPTASLAVWAYVVPFEAIQHNVLHGCISWWRFRDRSYRALAPSPGNNRVFGELTLSFQDYTALQRLLLTLRPTMKASTCSMGVTPASRFLATIDSSTLI